MSKHTPGPWCVDDHPKMQILMVVAEAGGMPGLIVNQGRITKTDRANARLIAAAPDLLEAAKQVLARLDHETAPVTMFDADKLRHAIAKAEGK